VRCLNPRQLPRKRLMELPVQAGWCSLCCDGAPPPLGQFWKAGPEVLPQRPLKTPTFPVAIGFPSSCWRNFCVGQLLCNRRSGCEDVKDNSFRHARLAHQGRSGKPWPRSICARNCKGFGVRGFAVGPFIGRPQGSLERPCHAPWRSSCARVCRYDQLGNGGF